MKIVDIADEIYRDLSEPTDLSIAKIAFWLRANIGQLNTLLNIAISEDADMEFDPELIDEEKDILKQLYLIRYYNKKATENLGSSAYQWTEVSEGDTRIKRASKTDVAKTYLVLKNDAEIEKNRLAALYRANRAVPHVINSNC